MDKELLISLANEKIASLETDLAKWKKFRQDIQTTDILYLDSENSLPAEPAPLSSPVIPEPVSKVNVAISQPQEENKLKWAGPIREYLEQKERKFIAASVIATGVLRALKIKKSDYQEMRPKIYAQLATFEKQDKILKEKRNKKVYYKWVGK